MAKRLMLWCRHRAFSGAGPKVWNSLPGYTRTVNTSNNFKHNLRTHLLTFHLTDYYNCSIIHLRCNAYRQLILRCRPGTKLPTAIVTVISITTNMDLKQQFSGSAMSKIHVYISRSSKCLSKPIQSLPVHCGIRSQKLPHSGYTVHQSDSM